MGVALRELVERKEIKLEDLKGKTIAIDAWNTLYQFLATIRTQTGDLLTYHGHVTSHLIGLFNRSAALLRAGIKPVFVFDGEAPELKAEEIGRRTKAKAEAREKYKEAKEAGRVEEMRKYAARTIRVTDTMLEDVQKLIELMGLPWVQAPAEGEAQAAFMVQQGDVWAVGSQDYDSLVHGGKRLVQNLAVSSRRAGKVVQPALIELPALLKAHNIKQDQLIALAMLIGTDYNPKGIKGIGPKTALKLVKEHGTKLDKLFAAVNWEEHCDIPWKRIFATIKDMPTTTRYKLDWKNPKTKPLLNFLVDERGFSGDRVVKTLKGLPTQQKGLGAFV